MSDARTRVDDFRDDILAGPDELARVLDAHRLAIGALPREALERPRWRFVGMGSSRFAAMDVVAALRATGEDVAVELASSSAGMPAREDTLLVAISSSGRTPEVVAAAERHRGRSFVIGVTSRPDSALAGLSDAVLPLLGARGEVAGISSLSYRSTVAALRLLAASIVPAVGGLGIAAAVPALEALLAGRDAWLTIAASVLDTGRPVHLLGAGARLGTVEQAALMLREAPRIEATAYDTGDWLHVGLYTVFPGDAVVLFAGSDADDEAVETIRARGGRIVVVGATAIADADAAVPLPAAAIEDEAVRALVEPAVGELLAAELWRRADATVLDDGAGAP